MWSALCVTLAEILEVRGSNLTEDEAWVLLYAIGRQLKNVPDEISQNFVIVPENVQLHRNGGLSIKFVSRYQNVFPELQQLGDAIGNALIYSLGMSLLLCLQNGLPQGQYLSVSDDLQDIIDVMISHQRAHSKFEEITNHRRFQSGDWELHVTECFRELYKSIFGSISDMLSYQDCKDVAKPETVDKSVQVIEKDCKSCIPARDRKELPLRPSHESVTDVSQVEPKENKLLQSPSRFPEVSEKEVDPQIAGRHLTESVRNKKSMLFCSEPPMQLNLCQMSSNFKHASHVTVEYLNQKKLRIHLDTHRLTCGQVLGVSSYHLVAPLDPNSFCLTLLKDGEYVLLKPDVIVADVTSSNFKETEPRFYLRLKFVPDDLNSVLDNHLMKAMYMQTRRDILEGFIWCKTDEALLLAAYSLQYELGDLEHSMSTFRLRDYIPPHIILRHGMNYLRVSLQCLHTRLKTTTKGCGRTLYMRKAIELSEYGSHSIFIFLTKKRQHAASGRLLISPRGVKVLRLQGEERQLLHEFSWETLEKVSFKNISISMVAKNGLKVKFYVNRESRSKYVVLMLGEAHRYHRLHDFRTVERFSHPIPPITPNIEVPRITIENDISNLDETSTDPDSGDVSPQYDNASHPEISPYELGPSHLPTNQPAVGLNPTSSVGSAMASVHVNCEHKGKFKKGDHSHEMYDELTDVSSQSSEDNVDDEKLPESEMPKASTFVHVVAPSPESSKQDDIYARPNKQKPALSSQATTHPLKENKMAKVPQLNPGKHGITVRHSDIVQHVSAGGLQMRVPSIETGSRGEGDGISNFSGPDQPDQSHARNVSREECSKGAIPEDVTNTIADFEEFKRRLIGQKHLKEQGSSGT